MNIVSSGNPEEVVALQRELRLCVNTVMQQFGTAYEADSPSDLIKKLCAEHREWGRQLGKFGRLHSCGSPLPYWLTFVENNWERISKRMQVNIKPRTEDEAKDLYLGWCNAIGAP